MPVLNLPGGVDNVSEINLLILASIFFLVSSFLILLTTFFYHVAKKKRAKRHQEVEEELNNWLAEVLAFGYDQPELPESLAKYFKAPIYHSYITERLIIIRKNLSGDSLHKVIQIYQRSGLKEGSVKKIQSSSWHSKARGIHELYMMMQKDMGHEISRYTNNENDLVRIEAQTAMISFEGFSGLQFLDTLSQPLTEWHQLQLTEQLNAGVTENITRLEHWLNSKNHHVVLFALKLAANFQQLHVHDEVVQCLLHKNEKVRAEAIHTLVRIANLFTADRLVKQYEYESTMNKKNILRSLFVIAGEEQQSFLVDELDNTDDDLKLLTAFAILSTQIDGEKILSEKARHQPLPYRQIFLHAKREVWK